MITSSTRLLSKGCGNVGCHANSDNMKVGLVPLCPFMKMMSIGKNATLVI